MSATSVSGGIIWWKLDVRNLSTRRRHLVNAYEVKAGIGVIAGNTVWSVPEHLSVRYYKKCGI